MVTVSKNATQMGRDQLPDPESLPPFRTHLTMVEAPHWPSWVHNQRQEGRDTPRVPSRWPRGCAHRAKYIHNSLRSRHGVIIICLHDSILIVPNLPLSFPRHKADPPVSEQGWWEGLGRRLHGGVLAEKLWLPDAFSVSFYPSSGSVDVGTLVFQTQESEITCSRCHSL